MHYLLRLFACFILVIPVSAFATAGNLVIVQGNGFSDATAAIPVGDNSGTTIGQQRANVFAKAAEIWTDTVNPSVNITISAQFASLYCEGDEVIFASGGSTASDRDFAGATYPSTWYPRALKNHLTATTSTTAAITISVNSNVGNLSCLSGDNWYYGYDHNPGANQIDLLNIVMHEISHGLGFITLVNLNSGINAGAKSSGFDDIFMKFLRDDNLDKNWPDMTNAERYASATNTNDLVWSGDQVQRVTDTVTDGLTNGYPRLHAPATLVVGTSVSHWDDNVTYPGAKHELMEHYPETPFDMALTAALMQDLGWNNVTYDYDDDGTADALDAFPVDPSEWLDTDNDDIGNNSDNDDDDDGTADISDNCPLTYNLSQLNTDGDSEGDACDSDDDNDTLSDTQETSSIPATLPKKADSDDDGILDPYDDAPMDATLLYQPTGTTKNDQQGKALAVGDMNNDGYDDILIGSPLADIPDFGVLLKDAGRIQVLSGADGSELNLFEGAVAKQQLGAAMVVVPDQDLDGIPDIVIGNPLADNVTLINGKTILLRDVGSIALHSGADGELLAPPYDLLIYGEKKGDHFGAAVAVDENNNLVVAAPLFDVTGAATLRDAGRVYVYTGISDTELYTRTGTQAKESFGSAVAINTVDNQLIVGSPGFDVLLPTKLVDVGRVQLFSTTDHSDDGPVDATEIQGQTKGRRFGSALTCFNQDIDSDTYTDWAVGMPKADILNGITGKTMRDAGLVQLFSGNITTPLEILLEGSTASDGFGTAINATGDINNDGVNDLLISTPKMDGSTSLKDNGQLDVKSGSGLF